MSLTQELRRQGWIYALLRQYLPSDFVAQIINGHNSKLARCQVIRPFNFEATDFKVSGKAMTYALRDVFGLKLGLADTPAGKVAAEFGMFDIMLRFLTELEHESTKRAALYVLLAGLEDVYRDGDFPNWMPNKSFMKGLPARGIHEALTQNKSIGPTVLDVARLLPALTDSLQLLVGSSLTTGMVHLNPTFEGSSLVGGADAQLITGSVLWDVRTTCKTAPFSIENLYQQIAYLILDYDNEYKIDTIAWFYPRQSCLLTYPIANLPFDLEVMREEVKGQEEYLIEDRSDSFYGSLDPYEW